MSSHWWSALWVSRYYAAERWSPYMHWTIGPRDVLHTCRPTSITQGLLVFICAVQRSAVYAREDFHT